MSWGNIHSPATRIADSEGHCWGSLDGCVLEVVSVPEDELSKCGFAPLVAPSTSMLLLSNLDESVSLTRTGARICDDSNSSLVALLLLETR